MMVDFRRSRRLDLYFIAKIRFMTTKTAPGRQMNISVSLGAIV